MTQNEQAELNYFNTCAPFNLILRDVKRYNYLLKKQRDELQREVNNLRRCGATSRRE